MIEYPKIETLYGRDESTFRVIPGRLRMPEFDLVKHWLVTEKIDGTNIRVHLKHGEVAYGGRTDAAQLPATIVAWLRARLPAERVAAAFDPHTEAVLFGEGYGPKIQKGGGSYRADVSFRLFDVAVQAPDRVWWLTWPDVQDVARKLEIATVPLLAEAAPLEQAIVLVTAVSRTAHEDGGGGCIHEGVVARTEPLLFTRAGKRVVWKLKGKDFAP